MIKNAFKRFDDFKPGSRISSMAVGNRVYNGTSPSPQAGPGSVNPAGYQVRDQKARMKRQLLQKQIRRG